MGLLRAALLGWFVLGSSPASLADSTAEGLALFREYEARGSRFDPSVADLYSDDALIKTKRLMPGGKAQELTHRGDKWKAMIRQLMPVAQQRGDRNTFNKVAAKPDGKQVVITAERYSHLKATRVRSRLWSARIRMSLEDCRGAIRDATLTSSARRISA